MTADPDTTQGADPSGLLLVEDDDDLREAFADLLRAEGYAVQTARNGREAFAALAGGPLPALVLLDLMMPDMNGREFLAARGREPRWRAIPVVIVSAVADLVPTDGSNVVASLSKPVDPLALFDLVARYCTRGAAAG